VFPRYEPGRPPPDNGPKFEEIVSLIRQDPRVAHASTIVGGMPMGNSMSITILTVPGAAPEGSDSDANRVSARMVTPEYHQALRIPLRSGRLFQSSDHAGAAPVVIVNEAVVRKFFAGQDPTGCAVTLLDNSRTFRGLIGYIYQ